MYWKWFNPSRVPIYFEYFIDAGEQITKLCEQFDPQKKYIDLNWSVFKALADWYPCPTHSNDKPGV